MILCEKHETESAGIRRPTVTRITRSVGLKAYNKSGTPTKATGPTSVRLLDHTQKEDDSKAEVSVDGLLSCVDLFDLYVDIGDDQLTPFVSSFRHLTNEVEDFAEDGKPTQSQSKNKNKMVRQNKMEAACEPSFPSLTNQIVGLVSNPSVSSSPFLFFFLFPICLWSDLI